MLAVLLSTTAISFYFTGMALQPLRLLLALIPLFVLAALLIVLGVAPVLVEGPVAAVAAAIL